MNDETKNSELTELQSYEKRLASALKNCQEYQKTIPDAMAKERVDILNAMPYSYNRYYVNMTLNEPITTTTTSLDERLKKIKKDYHSIDPINAFENGVIIELSVETTNDCSQKVTANATSYGYDDMLATLIKCYNDSENYYLSDLNDISGVENDIAMATLKASSLDSGKYVIIYAIASFSNSKLEELLNKKCEDGYSVYEYDMNDFSSTTIASPGKITSIEQSFVNWLDAHNAGSGAFKAVTKYNDKNTVVDIELDREYRLCNVVSLVKKRLHKIEVSDKTLMSYIYSGFKERYPGLMNDTDTAKYNEYIAQNGSEAFGSTWEEIIEFYGAYEYLFTTDSELTEDEEKMKSAVSSSMHAFEYARYLYNVNDFDMLKQSWNDEVVGYSEFKYAPYKGSIVMPPCLVLVNDSSFSKTLGKSYSVMTNSNGAGEELVVVDLVEDDENGKRMFVSDDALYVEDSKKIENTNKIVTERSRLTLDDICYELCVSEIGTENSRWYDQANDEYIDGILDCSDRAYVNAIDSVFFKSADIFTMLRQVNCKISSIPDKVTTYTKFIQYSSHFSLSNAEISKEFAEKTFAGKYSRLVIDTIPTDPWEELIESLDENCDKVKMLISLKSGNYTGSESIKSLLNGMFETENIENTLSLCSKTFCDKPMMFVQQEVIGDTDEPLTYFEIAKNIRTICGVESIEDVTYETICNSIAWKMNDSILNQFSSDDFEKFMHEYNDEKTDIYSIFKKNVPVYMMNGRIFYPTGLDIYTVSDEEFNVVKRYSIIDKFETLQTSKAIKASDNISVSKYYSYDSKNASVNTILGDGATMTPIVNEDKTLTAVASVNAVSNETPQASAYDEITRNWASAIKTAKDTIISFFDETKVDYKTALNSFNMLDDNLTKYVVYPLSEDIAYVPSPGSSNRFLIYRVEKVKCSCPNCAGSANGFCGLKGQFICRNKLSYRFNRQGDLLKQYLYYMHRDSKDKLENYVNNSNTILEQVNDDSLMLSISNDTIAAYIEQMIMLKEMLMTYFADLIVACNIGYKELSESIKEFTYTILYSILVKLVIDTGMKKMKFTDFMQLDIQTTIDKIMSNAIEKLENIDETLRDNIVDAANRAQFILPDMKRFSEYIDFSGNIVYGTSINDISESLKKKLENMMMNAIVIGNCKYFNISRADSNAILTYFKDNEKYSIEKILEEKYTKIEVPVTYENIITINPANEYTSNIKAGWNEMTNMIGTIVHNDYIAGDFSIFDKTKLMFTYINNASEPVIDEVKNSSTKLEAAKTVYKNAMKINSAAKKRLS